MASHGWVTWALFSMKKGEVQAGLTDGQTALPAVLLLGRRKVWTASSDGLMGLLEGVIRLMGVCSPAFWPLPLASSMDMLPPCVFK